MKFNIISYTLFLFVLAVFFPPLIFAPWRDIKPPKKPEDLTIKMTCPEWIEFSGFTLGNYKENRKLALYRNVMLDENASSWAAIYAFQIGGNRRPPKLLPKEFCNSFEENKNKKKYKFSALKEETRTCHGWISLYGFKNNDHGYNTRYAKNQKLDKIGAISIWAYSFYTFVITWKKQFSITPKNFCDRIGILTDDNAESKDFMNTYGPKLTCKAWIELYEYDDDIGKNYDKAKRLLGDFNIPIQFGAHYLPRKYASYMESKELSDVTENNMTPLQFCRNHIVGDDDSTEYSFLYKG